MRAEPQRHPKLEHFARSLLDGQKYHDLEDLVDGIDLDYAWGVADLQPGRIPVDSINRKNELIRESLLSLPGLIASLSTVPDDRRSWAAAVLCFLRQAIGSRQYTWRNWWRRVVLLLTVASVSLFGEPSDLQAMTCGRQGPTKAIR